jgi:hypothetical protein
MTRCRRSRPRCGWLIVPENRSQTMPAFVYLVPVVMLSAVDKKGSDPIVYMEGGPGGPVVPSAQVMVEAKINQYRDVILLGQRGSLYAKPSLICPEVDATNAPLVSLMRNGPEAEALRRRQPRLPRAPGQGRRRPRRYNTTETPPTSPSCARR